LLVLLAGAADLAAQDRLVRRFGTADGLVPARQDSGGRGPTPGTLVAYLSQR
jgi:hypothetical protein